MIKSLSYSNANQDWHLKRIDFDRLTLLVGASGVGKTRILYAINGLRLISSGRALPGRSWECTIVAGDGKEYLWSGQYDQTNDYYDESDQDYDDGSFDVDDAPRMIREHLSCEGSEIFARDAKGIKFNGTGMPKLPSDRSLLATLKEEPSVSPVADALQKVVLSQGSKAIASEGYMFSIYQPNRVLKTIKTSEDIKSSSLRVVERLYASQQLDPATFGKFRSKFSEIFPNVEDIKLDRMKESDDEPMVALAIKERGVDAWIEHDKISSGMLRTALHLAEILLLPANSVLLIDEFENSLGVNCIDVVTQEVLDASVRMQCIITSHHPYVINNIGFAHWRVVVREGSTVSVRLPSDLGIGRSSHEKFLQLLNTKSFQGG